MDTPMAVEFTPTTVLGPCRPPEAQSVWGITGEAFLICFCAAPARMALGWLFTCTPESPEQPPAGDGPRWQAGSERGAADCAGGLRGTQAKLIRAWSGGGPGAFSSGAEGYPLQ